MKGMQALFTILHATLYICIMSTYIDESLPKTHSVVRLRLKPITDAYFSQLNNMRMCSTSSNVSVLYKNECKVSNYTKMLRRVSSLQKRKYEVLLYMLLRSR